jgi:signal transduction histidine kinase
VGAVYLYDENDEALVLQGLHTNNPYEQPNEQPKPRPNDRQYIRKWDKEGRKVGVTGRAWLAGQSQLVKDVKRNPDCDEAVKTPLSELAVPILDRDSDKVIGVLSVESGRIAAFDEGDQQALEALAELVVLAIRNARQFEELREAKLLVNTRTTLAWMGIGNTVRRHEMNNYVGTIRSDLFLLSKELKRLNVASEQIQRTLERIERMARAAAKMNRSLSGRVDAQRKPFLINKDLIHSWSRRFNAGKLDPSVHLRQSCELAETATARANVFWLKQVLDILVNNAIEATSHISERIIVLGSRRKGSRAEVYVSDNGPGIPEPVRRKLFREPIEKARGTKGLGMGLLVAHAIVQIYGGSMYVDDMSGGGTTLVISLPLERGL